MFSHLESINGVLGKRFPFGTFLEHVPGSLGHAPGVTPNFPSQRKIDVFKSSWNWYHSKDLFKLNIFHVKTLVWKSIFLLPGRILDFWWRHHQSEDKSRVLITYCHNFHSNHRKSPKMFNPYVFVVLNPKIKVMIYKNYDFTAIQPIF